MSAAPKTKIALLDAQGTLIGFAEADTGAEGVEVPYDCDLRPRKYSYDASRKAFMPILERLDAPGPAKIDNLDAILLALIKIRDAALVAFDPETLQALKAYEGSVWYEDLMRRRAERGKT